MTVQLNRRRMLAAQSACCHVIDIDRFWVVGTGICRVNTLLITEEVEKKMKGRGEGDKRKGEVVGGGGRRSGFTPSALEGMATDGELEGEATGGRRRKRRKEEVEAEEVGGYEAIWWIQSHLRGRKACFSFLHRARLFVL